MLTLAAWLHNIDPFAIQFPEGFILPGIRWYGLAYLTAFAAGYLFALRIAKVGISTLRTAEVMDFVITVAIAVVVGGRLGYVFFYKPSLLVTFVDHFPWWGVFQLDQGGMASHGGMLGVGAVCWWYAWRSTRPKHIDAALTKPLEPAVAGRLTSDGKLNDHTMCAKCSYDLHGINIAADCPECGTPVKKSFSVHRWLHLFDITTMAATVGFFLGRIANFINAELIGRVCSPDLPWAVQFPQDLYDISGKWIRTTGAPHDEAAGKLMELTPAVEQLGIKASEWHDAIANNDISTVDHAIHGLISLIQDGGPKGSIVGERVASLLTTHHPSQLYAAITEGLIVFIILAWVWRKPRKPGVIAGLFGGFYGIMRIFNEFYRTPDAHIAGQEFAHYGFTRGQLLSAILAVAGFLLAWWCSRRKVGLMGGWMTGSRELVK